MKNIETNDDFQPVGLKVFILSQKQREEILEAFIAKYGGQPDDFVQITTVDGNQSHWCVVKKEVYKKLFPNSPLTKV